MTQGSPRDTLSRLWSPVLAITTSYRDRANGQIAIAGLPGSLLSEAPRIVIELWKANLTHDLVQASGVFALHLLPATPDAALDGSLALVHTLGMRSGHTVDKMVGIPCRPGLTSSPILLGSLSYIEARVLATLDGGEMTIFLADVLIGERLRKGEPLTVSTLHERIPPEWLQEWKVGQERQLVEARKRRGITG